MRCTRVGIEGLLNYEDKKEVVEVLSKENLVYDIVDNDRTSKDGLSNADINLDDDYKLLPSLREQLRVLATTVQVLDYQSVISADARYVLLFCQRILRTTQTASLVQGDIKMKTCFQKT